MPTMQHLTYHSETIPPGNREVSDGVSLIRYRNRGHVFRRDDFNDTCCYEEYQSHSEILMGVTCVRQVRLMASSPGNVSALLEAGAVPKLLSLLERTDDAGASECNSN